MTPSGSPLPIPTPPDPSPLPVAIVFVVVLLVASGLLWWQVRRAWRQRGEEAGQGPWPSNGHDPGRPRR